jgi:hypothetical protein
MTILTEKQLRRIIKEEISNKSTRRDGTKIRVFWANCDGDEYEPGKAFATVKRGTWVNPDGEPWSARAQKTLDTIAKRGSGKGGGEDVDGHPIENFDNVIVVNNRW